jgi:hypothetical protein
MYTANRGADIDMRACIQDIRQAHLVLETEQIFDLATADINDRRDTKILRAERLPG